MTLYVIVSMLYILIKKRRKILSMSKKKVEEKMKSSRISFIDDAIKSGRYPNTEKLAKDLEVTTRTIGRDIEFLKRVYKAPIEHDPIRRGYYYTDSTFFIKSVFLSEDDLNTVTLFDNFIKKKHYNEDDLAVKIRKIIDKLLLAMPEEQTNSLPFSPKSKEIPNFIFKPEMSIQVQHDLIIQMAISKKKVLEIEYWTTDNKKYTKQEIEPLDLVEQGEHSFVLAYKKGNHEKPLFYSLYNISKVKDTGKKFVIPADFKISKYIKKEGNNVSPTDKETYHFELSFPKEVASEAIEKTYYHNQHIKLCEDGTVYVSFDTTLLQEMYKWVLGEGHNVKVLNPPELVNMLKMEVQKLVKYYL